MKAEPLDWNITIVGAWNLAILTPDGVAKRVLGLPPGTPVEVQVAIDQLAPMRVLHGDLMVVPSKGMLLIQPSESHLMNLKKAAEAGQRILSSLPETPIRAAGVNFRYHFDTIPASLRELLTSPIDNRLADSEFEIASRQLKRTVAWRPHSLNIDIKEASDASCSVEFNFHCPSSDRDVLTGWLARVDEMGACVRQTLKQVGEIEVAI